MHYIKIGIDRSVLKSPGIAYRTTIRSFGFIGKTGRGVPEVCNVMGRVDIITGTLGKALGGAMGGYTTGKKEIIE